MFIELANGVVKDVPYRMEAGVAKRVLDLGARILSLSGRTIQESKVAQRSHLGQVEDKNMSALKLYNLALKWANGRVLSDDEYLAQNKTIETKEVKAEIKPVKNVSLDLDMKMTRKEMQEKVVNAGYDWDDTLTKKEIVNIYGN